MMVGAPTNPITVDPQWGIIGEKWCRWACLSCNTMYLGCLSWKLIYVRRQKVVGSNNSDPRRYLENKILVYGWFQNQGVEKMDKTMEKLNPCYRGNTHGNKNLEPLGIQFVFPQSREWRGRWKKTAFCVVWLQHWQCQLIPVRPWLNMDDQKFMSMFNQDVMVQPAKYVQFNQIIRRMSMFNQLCVNVQPVV